MSWSTYFVKVPGSQIRKSHLPFLAVILLVVTFAHGLLLIMDGVYWDSWLLYAANATDDWEPISTMWAGTGLPWRAFPHELLGYTPDFVLAHHVLAFLFIAGAACFVYLILVRSGFFTRLESFLIACLSAVYPALQTAFVLEVTEFVFGYFAFIVGVYLALCAQDTRGHARIAWRVVALVFFVASFTTRSLLVYYFGFLIFLFAYLWRHNRPPVTAYWKELLKQIDFLVLPFPFWFLVRAFFPATSTLPDANELQFDLSVIVKHLQAYFTNAGWMPTAQLGFSQPIVLAVGVIFLVIFQCFFPRLDKLAAERAPFPLATWVSLAYGILLFFFAAFPYAMVGKSPAVEGWTTRHALLSGLPMAIILVSLARFLFQQPKFIWRRVGYGALVFLVIAFSLRLAQNYLAWQSRWVKDKSVMLQLEASKAARQSSTLWIRDGFPLVGQEPYRYYEWSSMFTVIWGDESRIGLGDVRNRNQTLKLDFDRRLNLSEYNHNGCQALMTIQPVARNMPDAIQYFALKFFANHNAMDAYLREVAKVTVTVLDNQPRRCKVGTP